MDPLTTLALQVQRGNREAFALLFDEYHQKIYAFIYYRTFHKETAEDLTSHTFLKALERIDSFDSGKGTFTSWLYQIARNTVIDHYKTKRPTEDIEAAWDIAGSTDHARDVDAAQKLEHVREVLKTLPKLQQDIVIMRVWDGLSHKEIAGILNISEANAKMSYSRAMNSITKEAAALLLFISLTLPHL